MSSSLGYSLIEEFGPKNKKMNNNKTRKQKITTTDLNEPTNITPFQEGFEEQDNYKEESYPDRDPTSAASERLDKKKSYVSEESNDLPVDKPVEQLDNQYASYKDNNNNMYNINYASNSYPVVNESFENSNVESELTQKLNYMIRLLEEQHDDKIKSVTEEVILYGFLGVFIIYIVDSFAKIGKYVR